MHVVDRAHQVGVAVLRIAVGVIFLWAGLEKVLGAGPEGWSAAGPARPCASLSAIRGDT